MFVSNDNRAGSPAAAQDRDSAQRQENEEDEDGDEDLHLEPFFTEDPARIRHPGAAKIGRRSLRTNRTDDKKPCDCGACVHESLVPSSSTGGRLEFTARIAETFGSPRTVSFGVVYDEEVEGEIALPSELQSDLASAKSPRRWSRAATGFVVRAGVGKNIAPMIKVGTPVVFVLDYGHPGAAAPGRGVLSVTCPGDAKLSPDDDLMSRDDVGAEGQAGGENGEDGEDEEALIEFVVADDLPPDCIPFIYIQNADVRIDSVECPGGPMIKSSRKN
jgi:hypothetical protein